LTLKDSNQKTQRIIFSDRTEERNMINPEPSRKASSCFSI
jgi:hypothetical protein